MYMGNKGTKQFLDLLNAILNRKEIPHDCNVGVKLPLYKKGASANYTGITLTSVPGKVLTRVIEKRLRDKIATWI